MKQTAIKERPIIFSGPMVRAILDGSKTQTRRVVKPQPCHGYDGYNGAYECETVGQCALCGDEGGNPIVSPYGKPGDRLWVREAWNTVNPEDEPTSVLYKADGAVMYRPFPSVEAGWKAEQDAESLDAHLWNSPIFMPRWASRITLEVTDVRVERVQDIGEADAAAEGIVCPPQFTGLADGLPVENPDAEGWHPVDAFADLWDSINAKRGYSWESNPWVWAVTFKRIEDSDETH